MESHLRYCHKTSQFRPCSSNAKVQRRLKHILDQVESRSKDGEKIDGRTFDLLVGEAANKFPFSKKCVPGCAAVSPVVAPST